MDQSPEDEVWKPSFNNVLCPSNDRLCEACRRISIPSLTAELASPPSFWRELELENAIPGMSSKYGMRHLDSARLLASTVPECALCFLLLSDFGARYKIIEGLAEKPIFLSPLWTHGTATPKTPNPVEDRTPLMGMLVWVPIDSHRNAVARDGYVHCILRFYTDDGMINFGIHCKVFRFAYMAAV